MVCYSPLQGYKAANGGFTYDARLAIYPGAFMEVPCQQCIGCRREYARQWSIRMVHEAMMHDSACFITLTYSDEFLPPDGGCFYPHFQSFMKRLRKQYVPTCPKHLTGDARAAWLRRHGIRYYVCQEYGEEYARPHFHAVLFNIDFTSDRYVFKKTRQGHNLYRSPGLESCWKFGFSSIAEANFETANYVASYVTKRATGPLAKERYERLDAETGELYQVPPEMGCMSRRPGIGAWFYDKYKEDIYRHDSVVVRGIEMKPPKFYDKLLEREDPERLEALKKKRVAKALANADNNSADRLAVREQVALHRLSRKKRLVE